MSETRKKTTLMPDLLVDVRFKLFFLMTDAELRAHLDSEDAFERRAAQGELLVRELTRRRAFQEIPPPASVGPTW
jgi:hypothetical protein